MYNSSILWDDHEYYKYNQGHDLSPYLKWELGVQNSVWDLHVYIDTQVTLKAYKDLPYQLPLFAEKDKMKFEFWEEIWFLGKELWVFSQG